MNPAKPRVACRQRIAYAGPRWLEERQMRRAGAGDRGHALARALAYLLHSGCPWLVLEWLDAPRCCCSARVVVEASMAAQGLPTIPFGPA
jgi:hypothetical protein